MRVWIRQFGVGGVRHGGGAFRPRFAFFVILSCANAQFALGQPANDQCEQAELIACNSITVVDNSAATESVNDPAYSCHFGAPERGYGTVWCKFTATHDTAWLSTSATSTVSDTLLALYDTGLPQAPCDKLIELACSDDTGDPLSPFLSTVCAVGLIPGNTYYIQVAGWSPTDRGEIVLELSCPCPPRPPHDDCAFASPLPCQSTNLVDNTNATRGISDPIISCAGGPGFATLWYRFTATDSSALVSTCNTIGVGDTVLAVYAVDDPRNPCASLVPLACSDDAGCGFPFGQLSNVCVSGLTPGIEYYVEVAAFSEVYRGYIQVDVTCPCAPQCVECPPTAVAEGEPDCIKDYSDHFNGGCNSVPWIYQQVSCGTTICGRSGTYIDEFDNATRDTDWFEFTLSEPRPVSLRLVADFAAAMYLVQPVDLCDRVAYPASGSIAACNILELSACLEPGTYWIYVSPILFDGVPCGQSYSLTFQCGCGCPGDLSANGAVDAIDIEPFVRCVDAGSADGCCQCADLVPDGGLDAADVALFVQRALRTDACP